MLTPNSKSSRRRFLVQTLTASASVLAIPHLIPASALGLGASVAPSNRITVGMIGVGRQVLAYNLPFFGEPARLRSGGAVRCRPLAVGGDRRADRFVLR